MIVDQIPTKPAIMIQVKHPSNRPNTESQENLAMKRRQEWKSFFNTAQDDHIVEHSINFGDCSSINMAPTESVSMEKTTLFQVFQYCYFLANKAIIAKVLTYA